MPETLLLSDEARWHAVVNRDADAAPTFVVAVKTTGIYCRAGCPARVPYRKNVRFFDTSAEARAAGFRACKRCRPDETSSNHQRKGDGMSIRYALARTSLGWVIAAGTKKGLCFVALGDDRESLVNELHDSFATAEGPADDPPLRGWLDQVVETIEQGRPTTEPPLDTDGTLFQKQVWDVLRKVPPGQTITYGTIAERIGNPRAVRAVGAACGANPVSIVVPCHRAVRQGGALGGYRWGLDRKQTLLDREARPQSQ